MRAGTLGVLYSVTVFVSSAMLLVLEIVAGRLLAPYVGVSLYTWTSIIGVILAGLSLGNWLGGVLADRGWGHRAVGLFLVASAGFSLAILPLLVLIGGPIQSWEIDLLSASFAYVLLLFFLPSVLLGVITPLVTTIYLKLDQRTGTIVGRMHALAAFGSIVGTFITGFVLVQWMGTRNIIVMVAFILFFLALPFLFISRRSLSTVGLSLFALSLTGAIGFFTNGLANPCTVESNYYCLRVVEEKDANNRVNAHTMVIDHMVHSTNVIDDPAALWTPYIEIMDALIHSHLADPAQAKYFFAGGGAYTHPRSIAYRYPDAGITVSEIDPAVTALAEKSLFLNRTGMTIHHDDTRNILRYPGSETFDVMITDVFHDVGIPYHLTTLEYATLIADKLSKNGLYMLNVIDVFPSNQLIQSMVYTLKQVFPNVGVWIENPPQDETRLTFVITAAYIPGNDQPTVIQTLSGRKWYEIREFVEQQINENGATLLTDNYAPVERLLRRLLTTSAGS